MDYIKVEIHGKRKEKMALESILMSHDIYQIEEVSHDVVEELENDAFSWDYVDPDILKIDKEALILRFYLDGKQEDLFAEIKKQIEEAKLAKVSFEIIEEEDWANSWKEYFKPISITENLTIVPTWEDYQAKEGETIIHMDPGMAFGSGTHETTFMCMSLLNRYVKEGDLVFDIGCGSGILSLVAAAVGAEKVLGVDLDPICISASNHNVALNNMEDRIEIYEGDLFDVVEGKADLIVSNLFAEVIVGMLDDLLDHLDQGGIFIASGILVEKTDMVVQALESKGFTILESESKGDWACISARAAL